MNPDRARSFGAAADDYDRLRPAPAPEAVRRLLPGPGAAVLDLGAGTGLLTRALTAAGATDVVAVEPDDAMRGVLATRSPGVRVLAGTAEDVPLPDASVDAVLVASAWHWFDPDRASAEVGRVLRPGGVLGLLWTYWDPAQEWVAELRAIGGLDDQGRAPAVDADFVVDLPEGAPFGPGEPQVFRHAVWMAAADVAAMLGTHSAVLTLPADERAEVDRRAREHVARAVGTDPVRVPFVTAVWRAFRTSG
ncbi:class I SAM-dependent methyltransferase [Actinomycetospora straminea]|uniref:Class I SAM-dependent methyltransferase n=1 Tax=Actinomycetospora straminea TaxID=663607 RepID=A0ABP9EBX5_9PSEU|nr:class I SAM-dependent methyltransferase [Actinomycetospora straminea]MDD7934447.1 class I SAM-dependent methyltransferase [Actinomycetospora straminea]